MSISLSNKVNMIKIH